MRMGLQDAANSTGDRIGLDGELPSPRIDRRFPLQARKDRR